MNVKTLFFSPTNTTEKTVTRIASQINDLLNGSRHCESYNFTCPCFRSTMPHYTSKDIVIVGVPVYAGRVPNILLDALSRVEGNNALAIAVVSYGNRNYDDALIELKDILCTQKFKVIAAAAYIGEHSFSKTLAKDRPDVIDFQDADDFAVRIVKRIQNHTYSDPVIVSGNTPYRPYYRPKDPAGNPVDIRKVTPKTNELCIDCKKCVNICPMGSIPYDAPKTLTNICIKCGACIKSCPVNAKYYDDENYLRHKTELEIEFSERKVPEHFF